MIESNALRATPFSPRYPDTVGEAIDVYGCAVPLFITDPSAEYLALRNAVAVLEFSMLYKWDVQGQGAIEVADAVFSRNLRALAPRRIAYGVVVDDAGFMIDDVTGVVLADDHVRIIGGNPQTAEALGLHGSDKGVTVTEIRDTLAVLSIQGPNSRQLVQKLTERDMSNQAFPYYTYDPDVTVAGIPTHINRMGFTAELGYELIVPVERALELWDAVFTAGADLGVTAASVAALMMARVEAGMIMGELEYDETVTPFECLMWWAIDFDKPNFQGRDALLAKKDDVRSRIVSITLDGDPEMFEGAHLSLDGEVVGHVTMAVPSPELGGVTLALARVAKGAAKVGTVLAAAGGGGEAKAEVQRTPVYDPDRIRVRG